MNRKFPSARRRTSRRRFTPQQTVILVMVGLLGIAWVAAGIAFVSSARQPQQETRAISQLSPQAFQITAATLTPTPEQSAPVACAQQAKNTRQGFVTNILEAGVLEVQIEDTPYLVRLAGVTLPNIGDLQDRINQKLRELAEDQPVLLVNDTSEKDSSGQLLRYVFVGELFLNDAVVREGLARYDSQGPDQACAIHLQQAEAQARAARVGLWQQAQVPTSTFVPFVTLDPANQAVCDCSIRYECFNFDTHAEAQNCFNACNDYNSKLDPDRDGLACEELP